MAHQIVVTGTNGVQGAAIARALQARGHRVRGLGRRVLASGDEGALLKALEGAAALVFTVPLDFRPGERERLAEVLQRASDRAGIDRLVLNTAAPVPDGLDRPLIRVLRTVRAIVRAAGVPSVVLQPTLYMDNLRAPWALPAIVSEGVFAYPLAPHTPASWMSHESLAAAVVGAVERPEAAGGVFDLGGPEALTGEEMAALLSRRLGRAIRYVPVPINDFAAGLNLAFGAPTGDHIADLYRHAANQPDALVRDPAGAALLGAPLESFAAFLERHDWQPVAGGGVQG